jgi:hypothetical protein
VLLIASFTATLACTAIPVVLLCAWLAAMLTFALAQIPIVLFVAGFTAFYTYATIPLVTE